MAEIELKDVCKSFDGKKEEKTYINGTLLNPLLARQNAEKELFFGFIKGAKEKKIVIDSVNLLIPDGKVTVVLGPSGCGKSTLLKLVAGLIPLDSGEIFYDGRNMNDVAPGERKIGMVFQDYALYPNFTSKKNILSYFFFNKDIPKPAEKAKEIYERTAQLMGVEVGHLLDSSPIKLSGGEKQRVAIARCITREPELFLMDEPFSSLDQKLREKYRLSLKRLLSQFRITSVYVTHDQQEAMLLADELVIMKAGAIEQTGKTRDIYDRPRNVFVAEFLNFASDAPAINLIKGVDLSPAWAGMIVGSRPEDVEVSRSAKDGLCIPGTVLEINENPVFKSSVVCADADHTKIYARVPGVAAFSQGEKVFLHLNKYHLFDDKSGERLETPAVS